MSAKTLVTGFIPWQPLLGRLSVLIFLLPCLIGAGAALAADPARILIVHANTQEYPWTKSQHQGFVTTLNQALPVPPIIKTEYLDTKRLDLSPGYAAWFGEYLNQKYQDFKPDAIYVTDDDGLRFGLDNLSGVFPDAPLFFSGVNDHQAREKLDPARHAGVFEKKEVGPNLDLLREFSAKDGTIVIVGDGSNPYRAIAEEIKQELAERSDVNVVFIAGASLKAILARLAETPGPVLLTTLGGLKDDEGHVLNLEQSIPLIAAGRDIVLTMEDTYQLDGVLGGFMTSGRTQGQAAGKLAAAHLAGRPMKALPPVVESPNEYVFNDAQLGALGLDLPEAVAQKARMINWRQGFIERHLQEVLTILFLLAIGLAVMLYLFTQVRRKNHLLQRVNRSLQHQEHLVRESEERFRRLFELSQDPMLLIHESRFVMANNASARMLGYADASELLKVHPSTLSPETQPDGQPSFHKAEALIKEAHDKGYLRFEWVHLRKDKTPRLTEVSLTRIPNPGGACNELFCVWHDITDRRRAEA